MPVPADNAFSLDLSERYQSSVRRLILLDYDGTLVPFAKDPQDAVPDRRLQTVLQSLSDDKRNTIVIISGRAKRFLEQHLKKFSITLIAEHGAFVCQPGLPWNSLHPFSTDWKEDVTDVLHKVAELCPNSFVEIKDSAVVWHYRDSDPANAEIRATHIKQTVAPMLRKRFEFDIIEGNKVIEFKAPGFDKGKTIRKLFSPYDFDFIFAAGDDMNDEPMFGVLPDNAVTVKIGTRNSSAKYYISEQEQFIPWLENIFTLHT